MVVENSGKRMATNMQGAVAYKQSFSYINAYHIAIRKVRVLEFRCRHFFSFVLVAHAIMPIASVGCDGDKLLRIAAVTLQYDSGKFLSCELQGFGEL